MRAFLNTILVGGVALVVAPIMAQNVPAAERMRYDRHGRAYSINTQGELRFHPEYADSWFPVTPETRDAGIHLAEARALYKYGARTEAAQLWFALEAMGQLAQNKRNPVISGASTAATQDLNRAIATDRLFAGAMPRAGTTAFYDSDLDQTYLVSHKAGFHFFAPGYWKLRRLPNAERDDAHAEPHRGGIERDDNGNVRAYLRGGTLYQRERAIQIGYHRYRNARDVAGVDEYIIRWREQTAYRTRYQIIDMERDRADICRESETELQYRCIEIVGSNRRYEAVQSLVFFFAGNADAGFIALSVRPDVALDQTEELFQALQNSISLPQDIAGF